MVSVNRRRRSWLAIVLGAPLVFIGALFVLFAIVDLVIGEGDWVGPLGGGIFMGLVAAVGLLMVRWGARWVDDFDMAKAARKQALRMLDTSDPKSHALNQAAGLLLDKRFQEAIAAFSSCAERYPETRGTAYANIGAAHFFLGDYHEAIRWYRQGEAHGADPALMRDNIEEAEGKLR